MPAGQLRYVVSCVVAGQGGKETISPDSNPCGIVGADQTYPLPVQVYSIYPESQSYIDGLVVPFDYVLAASIFSFFFSFTVGCWIVAKNAGVILEAVRRW